jgi:DNA ligase (NAD+)
MTEASKANHPAAERAAWLTRELNRHLHAYHVLDSRRRI